MIFIGITYDLLSPYLSVFAADFFLFLLPIETSWANFGGFPELRFGSLKLY